jgi:hypothetical protein
MKLKTRGFLMSTLFSAWCATNLFAAEAPTAGSESLLKPVGNGWQPVFNGKDLHGWKVEPGFWKVENGAVTTCFFCKLDQP